MYIDIDIVMKLLRRRSKCGDNDTNNSNMSVHHLCQEVHLDEPGYWAEELSFEHAKLLSIVCGDVVGVTSRECDFVVVAVRWDVGIRCASAIRVRVGIAIRDSRRENTCSEVGDRRKILSFFRRRPRQLMMPLLSQMFVSRCHLSPTSQTQS